MVAPVKAPPVLRIIWQQLDREDFKKLLDDLEAGEPFRRGWLF